MPLAHVAALTWSMGVAAYVILAIPCTIVLYIVFGGMYFVSKGADPKVRLAQIIVGTISAINLCIILAFTNLLIRLSEANTIDCAWFLGSIASTLIAFGTIYFVRKE